MKRNNCRGCNIRANFNRDYWFVYFTYIIGNYTYAEKN